MRRLLQAAAGILLLMVLLWAYDNYSGYLRERTLPAPSAKELQETPLARAMNDDRRRVRAAQFDGEFRRVSSLLDRAARAHRDVSAARIRLSRAQDLAQAQRWDAARRTLNLAELLIPKNREKVVAAEEGDPASPQDEIEGREVRR
ncbi:MAG: hypothetical protein WCU88_05845 [Elusimicrobiota bacterium]|jgi:hypothetical protein